MRGNGLMELKDMEDGYKVSLKELTIKKSKENLKDGLRLEESPLKRQTKLLPTLFAEDNVCIEMKKDPVIIAVCISLGILFILFKHTDNFLKESVFLGFENLPVLFGVACVGLGLFDCIYRFRKKTASGSIDMIRSILIMLFGIFLLIFG